MVLQSEQSPQKIRSRTLSHASSLAKARCSVNNQIIRLIQSTRGAGVEIFNFALYPDCPEGVKYNQISPDACVTHFTSDHVWQKGIASEILQEFTSKIHPEDLAVVSAYVQTHLARAQRGLDDSDIEEFSSERFRGLTEDGRWGWYEIRSRLYRTASGLVIAEGVFTDVTQLMELLLTDNLTPLGNRKSLEQRLDSIGRCTTATSLALINIDLDDFKSINDSLGQQYGDAIIVETARILSKHLPCGASLYRLEADEFMLLLLDEPSGTTESINQPSKVLDLAKRLQLAIRSSFQQHESLSLHLTACCGIAVSQGGLDNMRALIQQANTALWRAKQGRAENCCLYSKIISLSIQSRIELKRTLDHALSSGELFLNYQPQVNRGGQLIGAEALVRWQKPDGQIISPAQFIPVAEQTGQIRKLDHWVQVEMCGHLAAWVREGLTPPRISINLSSVELERLHGEPSLTDQILSVCDRHSIHPRLISVELTETAIVQDWQEAVTQLQPLADAGVEIAIDDFGTGFSSLKLLQLLPIKKIKLDMSFIRNLPDSDNDFRIVAGSIQMAHSLGITVVAEGVESECQRQCLTALECDEFQGYLFDKPISEENFRHWLRLGPSLQ